jgi:hypothetical protein
LYRQSLNKNISTLYCKSIILIQTTQYRSGWFIPDIKIVSKRWIQAIQIGMIFLNCFSVQCQSAKVAPEDTIIYNTQLLDDNSKIPYYQCDDYNAFRVIPDTKNIEKLYHVTFKISKDTVANRQYSKLTDTIYTYEISGNKIKIYKAYHADLLALFDVSGPAFELNGKIRPGMLKKNFIRRFNLQEPVRDTLDLGNMEHTFVIRFYFSKNKIKRIRIVPYLD